MITINVKTKAVTLDRDTPVMARNQFGNATYGYVRGWIEPNYPMPAIPLAVKYDYLGCVNIDNVSNPDDPIVIWFYDSWNKDNGETEALKADVSLYV